MEKRPERFDFVSGSWDRITPLENGDNFVWKSKEKDDQPETSFIAYTVPKNRPVSSFLSVRTPTIAPEIINTITFGGVNYNVLMGFNGLGYPSTVSIFEDIDNYDNHVLWELGRSPVALVKSARSFENNDNGGYDLVNEYGETRLSFWLRNQEIVAYSPDWGGFHTKINLFNIPLEQLLLFNPHKWGQDEHAPLFAKRIDYFSKRIFVDFT
jgi:hypothetical protein